MRFSALIISVSVLHVLTPALATPATPTRLQRRDWYPFLRDLVSWKDCLQHRLNRFIEIKGVSSPDLIVDFLEDCIARDPPECCGVGPKGGPSVNVELDERYQLRITRLAGQVFRSVAHQFEATWRRWGSSAAVSLLLTTFISRVAPVAARALAAA